MLGKCANCGGVVSSHAERCPRCDAIDPYSPPPPPPAPPPPPPPPAALAIDAYDSYNAPLENRSGASRWLIGLVAAIIAVGVGAVAKFGVQELMRPPSEAQQIANATDSELISRMERSLSEMPNAEYLTRMRTTFPEEYRQFVEGFVPIIRGSASSTEQQQRAQAFAYAQSYMRAFVTRQSGYIAQSEPELVSRWLTAQVTSLSALRTANVQACAEVVEFGEVRAETGLATYQSVTDLLQSQATLVFDMIESGRRAPHQHAPMTDADWQRLYDSALSSGADPVALSTVGTPQFALLQAQEKCDLGLSIYRGALAEPDLNTRARVGIALFTGG